MSAMSARQKVIAVLISLGMLVALSSPASARGTAGLTLTASSKNVAFHGIVTLVATVAPAVAGQEISIVDASGQVLASGTTGSDGTFSTDVHPAANIVVHASSLGVDSAPVSVGVRPLVTLTSGAVRLFDDVTVRGTFKPVRQGLRVTVELQHRGDVVSTKRVVMDANGRFKATFVVPQAGSYRARAVLDAPDLLPGRAATAPSVTTLPDLASGAHGIYVSLLERRLVQLHYHLVGVDDVFDYRTADAVMAFRKVQGMARIQTVDAATWRALGAPKTFVPRDRSDGYHIEVDQTRQVLVTVRDGQRREHHPRVDREALHADPGRFVPRLLEAGGVQPEALVLPELLRRGARDPRVDRRTDVRRQPRMRADPVLGHAVDVRPGPDRDTGPHLPLSRR